MKRKIVIATRGSRLALAQANIIKRLLEENECQCTLFTVSTKGDRDRVSPLAAIGGNGLFVREIEKTLLSSKADIAVHSGKDLPYKLADGLTVAGVPEAADCRDCLVTVKGKPLPASPVIGTGSPRRRQQAQRIFPLAVFSEIRGNVDTRLKKLKSGEYDGIILAKAGLDRLKPDLSDFEVTAFSPEDFIPAACQGIIAAECRSDDTETVRLLSKISHGESLLRFNAERYMLSLLETDCSSAVGVHSKINGGFISIRAMFCGKRAECSGRKEDYKYLCEKIREEIYE